MHTFEISNSARFPSELTGFLAPDNIEKHKLTDSMEEFYGSDRTVIALFLSEYMTRFYIPMLVDYATKDNGLGFTLGGIVTFGVHKDISKRGLSHLDIVAEDLNLPFLQLDIPSDIPMPSPSGIGFEKKWIYNNPLKSLFFEPATITISDTSATFTPAEM